MKHHEADMQAAIVAQTDAIFAIRWPDLMVKLDSGMVAPLYTPRNEGKRTPQAGRRAKAQGLRSGVPDLFLPYPTALFGGLYIELKTATGRVSKNQQSWLDYLAVVGYKVIVCRTVKEAVDAIIKYMGGKI